MSKILLRFGRILGGLAVLIFMGGFLLVIIGSLLEDPVDPNNNGDFLEVLPMVIMIPMQLLFYIITWFPKKNGEFIGGIGMTTISLCMGGYLIYDAGSQKLKMGSIFCIPFLIPGILFIIYSQMKKKEE